MNSGTKYAAALLTSALIVLIVATFVVREVATGGERLAAIGFVTEVTAESAPARVTEPAIPAETTPTITTRWSATHTTLHKREEVRGRVPGSPSLLVDLQQELPSGWRTVVTSKTDSQGRFRLSIPTGWVYSAKLRVVAPGVTESGSILNLASIELGPEVSNARTFTVSTPYEPAGRVDGFRLQPGNPRYNPCEPIPYRVNLTHSPKGAVKRLDSALARITEASGLTFRYEGATTDKPSTPAAIDRAGILVAWGAIPEEPRAEAAARPMRTTRASDANGDATLIHSSEVVIATKFTHSPYELEDLLMHELGHAVGLSHDPHAWWVLWGSSENLIQEQKMAATGHTINMHWGAGDLNGFSKVGLASGCISNNTADVRP